MTPKVTVIAWVDNPTYDQVRYLIESFQRQDYPHKELLVANKSDWHPINNLPGRQFRLPWDTHIATTTSECVRLAEGEYCVVWKLGHWYHPQVLTLHMSHTDPYVETQVSLPGSGIVSQGFYRRAFHLTVLGQSKIVGIGGIGLVKKIGSAELEGAKYFYHSGNLGDIIYGLPGMKALGGGFLLLGPDMNFPEPIPMRELMSRALFGTLAPLLRRQPYIHQTYFYNFMPKVEYDLNRFRLVEWTGQNLSEMTMQGLGLEGKVFLNHADPWLQVEEPIFGKPVVIHRSTRYHNPKFPWWKVLTKYSGQIEFVGFPSEHVSFCKEFGVELPFYPTSDLLTLARRIAGATLFVGNQSCPCAIAEGLKVSIMQETDPKLANCKFDRNSVIYCADEHLFLPDLKTLPEKRQRKRRWVLKGIFAKKLLKGAKVFYHSGDLGDILYSLHVVQTMGGGDVVLGPTMADVRPAVRPRAVLNHALYGLLEPLVKCQSFVKSVRYVDMPLGAIDLNQFRHVEWQRANGFKYKSIVEMTREAVGLEPEFDTSAPWLDVADPIFTADVVIHRSSRFHSAEFPWKDIVAKYGKSAVFVGLREEHKEFVDEFGWVPYLPTVDMLVLAKVIAGCQLFVGNQSSPYAIAEGLKKATVQEMSTECPNCVFVRTNAVHGNDKFIPLPEIEPIFVENDEAWNENLVSFFTTCKNRIQHLQQTLPKNLEFHKDDRNVEFVVLDYSSDDGLNEWIKAEMMEHVISGKLVYFRANGYTKFQMSHSKNCAARLTRGAIICNLDSDNETGSKFADWLRRAVKPGHWAGTESFIDDFGGRQAFRRKDFYALSGFDERMIGWGSDDYDISRRAGVLGLKCVEIPVVYKYSLQHSNELRSRFMEIQDRDATNQMNLERAAKTHEDKIIRINPGRWGVVLVERNFDGKLIAV